MLAVSFACRHRHNLCTVPYYSTVAKLLHRYRAVKHIWISQTKSCKQLPEALTRDPWSWPISPGSSGKHQWQSIKALLNPCSPNIEKCSVHIIFHVLSTCAKFIFQWLIHNSSFPAPAPSPLHELAATEILRHDPCDPTRMHHRGSRAGRDLALKGMCLCNATLAFCTHCPPSEHLPQNKNYGVREEPTTHCHISSEQQQPQLK